MSLILEILRKKIVGKKYPASQFQQTFASCRLPRFQLNDLCGSVKFSKLEPQSINTGGRTHDFQICAFKIAIVSSPACLTHQVLTSSGQTQCHCPG